MYREYSSKAQTGSFKKGLKLLLSASFVALFSLPLTGAAAQSGPQLSARSLNVQGLNYETELTGLFLGDFENSRLEPDSLRFLTLLGGYIDAFSRQCQAFLPKDRVAITETHCVQERVTRNGYGAQIGPATCSRYQTSDTGRFADPQLMRLSTRLSARLTPGIVGTSLGLNGSDALGSSRQMIDIAASLGDDMPKLLQRNGCGSAAIKRLQANILRFGEGQPPLRLAGGATLSSVRSPATPKGAVFRDSNYGRLLDELVADNARGWMMNRYVGGSISNVVVQSRDSAGRPEQVSADYQFSGFSGQTGGSVTLTFKNGLPDCLYFFDAPQTCRLPSRRIITAYEKGEYR